MAKINNEQKVLLTVTPKTAAGNPTVVAAPPVWSSSDTNVVTVEAAPDGLTAFAVSNNVGTATVTVAANADLSGGTREISASVDIEVVAAEAATLEITEGTPEPK